MVGLTWEDCEEIRQENQRVMVIVLLAERLYEASQGYGNREEVESALFKAIEARWREQDMEIDAREID